MGLNSIGISSWQDDLVVSAMCACDFVIVKATGCEGCTRIQWASWELWGFSRCPTTRGASCRSRCGGSPRPSE